MHQWRLHAIWPSHGHRDRARFSEFCNHLYCTILYILYYTVSLSALDECIRFEPQNLTRECDERDEFPADKYFPQLRECVGEAATMFPSINNTYVNLTNTQLTQLYINTTTCVLAKTRCSYLNPVTGEQLQDGDIVNKLHLPSLNAILVNTDYDISIVQLPFRHGSVDVCAKYRNVEQATWPSVVC